MVFRQQGADEFRRMMIDQFDEMLLLSRKYSLLYTIVLHPFVIGQPYRLRALRAALDHIAAHLDDAWLATPGDVARHYARLFPPSP
jgi:allantoinase